MQWLRIANDIVAFPAYHMDACNKHRRPSSLLRNQLFDSVDFSRLKLRGDKTDGEKVVDDGRPTGIRVLYQSPTYLLVDSPRDRRQSPLDGGITCACAVKPSY